MRNYRLLMRAVVGWGAVRKKEEEKRGEEGGEGEEARPHGWAGAMGGAGGGEVRVGCMKSEGGGWGAFCAAAACGHRCAAQGGNRGGWVVFDVWGVGVGVGAGAGVRCGNVDCAVLCSGEVGGRGGIFGRGVGGRGEKGVGGRCVKGAGFVEGGRGGGVSRSNGGAGWGGIGGRWGLGVRGEQGGVAAAPPGGVWGVGGVGRGGRVRGWVAGGSLRCGGGGGCRWGSRWRAVGCGWW